MPVNALLFRSEGLRAVVVDENHKTRLQALTIGRDYGTSLEVLQGLKASDWIVLNPADSLEDGIQVNVKQVPQSAPPADQSPQGNGAPNPNGGSTKSGTTAPSGGVQPSTDGRGAPGEQK